jgi:hypothetical protein
MSGKIKISELVDCVQTYLPASNVLSCSELTQMAKDVVSVLPSDDCQYMGEAKCKLLVYAGEINRMKSSVDSGGKKREKVGEVEVEFATENIRFVWDDFIKYAKNKVCPLFGYKYPLKKGMIINPSDEIKVNPNCNTHEDLQL